MAKLYLNDARTPVRRGVVLVAGSFLGFGAAPGAAMAQQDLPSGYATRPFTPPNFQMPEGSGCVGDIARWRAVQDNDYASGNVGLKIYHQIQGEIASAERACEAGQDGQARAMVAASRRRHGYPG